MDAETEGNLNVQIQGQAFLAVPVVQRIYPVIPLINNACHQYWGPKPIPIVQVRLCQLYLTIWQYLPYL